ncbi:MAG: RNA methyltransferase, partial [Lachnospiraceae bacterium]|nr:RNA methyltransferase [Lachnospiraceae bacterium]
MAEIINIDSLDIEELQIYKSGNEAQLLHYFEPNGGLFIAESPMVVERALDAGYEPYSMLIDEALLCKAQVPGDEAGKTVNDIITRCGDIPVYSGNEILLGKLTGFKLTRGILCAMYRKELHTIEDICKNATRIAVLDGVENPANVGSIFRNAAALGIDAVLLTSGCSDPLYRRSLRVSMGTSLILPWTI